MCASETLIQLGRLRDSLPGAVQYAKVVGRWVWITYPMPPDAVTRAMLKSLGYHWSNRRGAWQHPCGCTSKKSSGNPRRKYGELEAEAELRAAQV